MFGLKPLQDKIHINNTEAVSQLERRCIPRVAWRILRRLIGQTSAISTLTPLLTGNRGEYLRVVGIIVMVE